MKPERSFSDTLFKILLWGGAIFFLAIVMISFFFLFKGSLLSLKKFGIHFITGTIWDPATDKFGMLPFLIGTLVTSVLSLLISIPFSLSLGIFSGVFYTNGKISEIINTLSDLIAGIPSVIFGFWGLLFIVPLIQKMEIKFGLIPYGTGILTASILLSIMIIPYSSSMIREVVRLVPVELIEAGYSTGATRYEVIKKIVIPYARSGIIAGIMLAFGRAFGETMAVTMVIGNSNQIPTSIFSPGNTMASVIANEFTEATKDIHLSALIQIGLWLFIFTFIFNLIGQLIIEKTSAWK